MPGERPGLPGSTFRTARLADRVALGRVALAAKASWGYPFEWLLLWRTDLEVTAEEIERDWILLVEENGIAVGFTAVTRDDGAVEHGASGWTGCELAHLWVRPERMGRGLGRALVERAVDWSRCAGSKTLRIVSDPFARSFYEALGARPIGVQPSAPEGRELPVLLLDLSSPLPAPSGRRAVDPLPLRREARPSGAPGQASEEGVTIEPIATIDRAWVRRFLLAQAGALRMVSRGRLHQVDELPGLVAKWRGERAGLLTYHRDGDGFEVVTLHASVRSRGIGTALLTAAQEVAREERCRRLRLVTTNDNLPAIEFYRRRGLSLVAVHRGSVRDARRLKPEIPLRGLEGKAIEDEIEFERLL